MLNFTPQSGLVFEFLGVFITVNLILAFFNLFPCPPLDGSKIVAGFLPRPLAERLISLDRLGFILIILIIVVGRQFGFSVFGQWISFWIQTINPILSPLQNLW